MKLIDGKQLAANLRGEIAAGVAALKNEKGVTPGLAVILIGDNPASVSYVTAKEKACKEAGMYSKEIRLPATIAEQELLDQIAALNAEMHCALPLTFLRNRRICCDTSFMVCFPY